MECPVCKDVTLEMAERQGVEIDYCPDCRGIWLDRGELDKIIERSNERIRGQERRSGTDRSSHKKHHEKESFLSELLDF